jgi:hypothetical protein
MMACPLDATMRFSVANHEKELRSHAKRGYLGLLVGCSQVRGNQ